MESSYDAATVLPRKLFSDTQDTTVLSQNTPIRPKLSDVLKPPVDISFDTYCTQGSQAVLIKQPTLPKQPASIAAPKRSPPMDIDTPAPTKRRNPPKFPQTRMNLTPQPKRKRAPRPKKTPNPAKQRILKTPKAKAKQRTLKTPKAKAKAAKSAKATPRIVLTPKQLPASTPVKVAPVKKEHPSPKAKGNLPTVPVKFDLPDFEGEVDAPRECWNDSSQE